MTDEGTLIHLDGRPALRFERRYAHSVDRVWRAISDPGEMPSWFPSHVEGDRAVGADLAFLDDAHRAAARQAGEPTRDEGPITRGRVVAYDPPKVFSFTWGGELLRYELTPDGADTVLVFTQVLSHQSVAARNGGGWHMCLDTLGAVLDGTSSDHGAWRDLYQDYILRMGPELGTPTGDGGLTWERSTHVGPDRVRTVTTDPTEIEAWGGADHTDEPIHWDVEPNANGTLYRLTHDGIGDDATLAATWHARLIQLDMYLASGQLVPVEPKLWIDAYAERLR